MDKSITNIDARKNKKIEENLELLKLLELNELTNSSKTSCWHDLYRHKKEK